MRTFLVSLLCVSALVFSTVSAEESACDMKTVVKMRYCENDLMLLEKTDVVHDTTYYECEECEGVSESPGTCPDCEEPKLVKKTTGKNACKHCFSPTIEVEVCVKEFYACPECGHEAAKAGPCPECEDSVNLVKQVSRAVIVYECDGCGETRHAAGTCTDPDCEHKGKALVRRCSYSGESPHTR